MVIENGACRADSVKLRGGSKLGQVLLDEGLVTEADLLRALEAQDQGTTSGSVSSSSTSASSPPKAMLSALAKQLGVKGCHLRHGLIDPAAARLLDREEAIPPQKCCPCSKWATR